MGKAYNCLFIFFSITLFFSCSKREINFSEIQIGMSLKEAKKMLGEPIQIDVENDVNMYFWLDHKKRVLSLSFKSKNPKIFSMIINKKEGNSFSMEERLQLAESISGVNKEQWSISRFNKHGHPIYLYKDVEIYFSENPLGLLINKAKD